MPRKGGRDAFLEMRAIDPSVSVLICSGYGDNEEAQSMISLGAQGLLGKPFRMSDLAAHLSRLGRPQA
ncbi:MAG: response regulator, partial [Acidobacteria bacterium]|nr:response regulator [Acidobacteriota bacterium]